MLVFRRVVVVDIFHLTHCYKNLFHRPPGRLQRGEIGVLYPQQRVGEGRTRLTHQTRPTARTQNEAKGVTAEYAERFNNTRLHSRLRREDDE